MEEYEFEDTFDNDIDSTDYEFLINNESTMVLQIYNNMGEVDDIYLGYESIKKFVDGINR